MKAFRSIPRWTLAVAAAVAAAIAADVTLFFVTHHSSGGKRHGEAAPADGLVVIDPRAARVVTHVAVGKQPTLVAAGYGSVWVLNKDDGTITHIDAATRRVVRTLRLNPPVDDLSLTSDGLWVAGHGRLSTFTPHDPHGTTALRRLNLATDAVNRSLEIKSGGVVVAAAPTALWTSGFVDGDVRGGARSDPRTGLLRRLDVNVFGDLVAAGGQGAYYVTSLGARIQRVDEEGRLVATLNLAKVRDLVAGKLPPNPTGIVVGGGSVWLSQTDGTVLRIDPALTRIQDTIHACGNALAVAYGEGAAWVACGEGVAVRVDPRTNAASSPIDVGGLPRGIAAGGGAVWVTVN